MYVCVCVTMHKLFPWIFRTFYFHFCRRDIHDFLVFLNFSFGFQWIQKPTHLRMRLQSFLPFDYYIFCNFLFFSHCISLFSHSRPNRSSLVPVALYITMHRQMFEMHMHAFSLYERASMTYNALCAWSAAHFVNISWFEYFAMVSQCTHKRIQVK